MQSYYRLFDIPCQLQDIKVVYHRDELNGAHTFNHKTVNIIIILKISH